jgi:predicted RNA binding protein YcfA (HicA-like mRNA interferase family)
MNEILTFANNALSCFNNYDRWELENSCPVSRLTDSKTANVALVWLGAAGLVLASYELAKRLVPKKDPRMIQVFAARWKEANPVQSYIPMNGLFSEKDCAHLLKIFQSWRLHDEFFFFDLLGAQMHRNWKKAGVEKKDLRAFGEICANLSAIRVAVSLFHLEFGSEIKNIRKRLEDLGKRLPNVNAPELKIFLAALSDPRKTIVLGRSEVELFEGSEVVGTGESSRKDLNDFLAFAADKDPTLSTLLVSDDKKRWYALNSLLAQSHPNLDAAKVDRNSLLLQIKLLFEARTFGIKLPFRRLFENSSSLEEKLAELRPPDVRWIKHQYARFLGKQYLDELASMTSFANTKFQTDVSSSFVFMRHSFRQLAARSRMQGSLKDLESAILNRLQSARKSIEDEDDYGKLFAQMVCLYQTVHDLRIVVDPSKNQLGENLFPTSLSRLAFLSSTTPEEFSVDGVSPLSSSDASSRSSQNPENASNVSPEEDSSLLEEEEEGLLSDASSRSSQNSKQDSSVSPDGEPSSSEEGEEEQTLPHVKSKTRPKAPPAGTIPPAPPLPMNFFNEPEPEMTRPDFPEKASPEDALQHLLENGFVIERVRGSHYQMKHVLTHSQTTVPLHGDRLKTGTLGSIRSAFYKSQGFET